MDLKSLDLKSINFKSKFKSKSKFPNTTLSNMKGGGGAFTDNPSFNKNIMIKITLYKT